MVRNLRMAAARVARSGAAPRMAATPAARLGAVVRMAAVAAALAGAAAPAGAERWQVQYFYDKSKSTLALVDICFSSATRGVAVGQIQEKHRHKPVVLVTSDGGAHWLEAEAPGQPLSLFFLNENSGWLVTTHDLWATDEAGRSWRKVPGLPSGVVRVLFTDERTGYAAGSKKKAYKTEDGGQHWEAIAAAAEPPGEAKYSAYDWIAFANPKSGMITGWNEPPRLYPQQFPDWMDPAEAISRYDTPHLSYNLVTNDGGTTWKAQSASLFGAVTRIRFNPEGRGLGLLRYANSFRYPAEVYKIEWKSGKSETIYRDRRFAVSDIWLSPDGTAWLAGVVAPGQIRNVVPGKVQVLRSRGTDYTVWKAIDIDYRAVANAVLFAGTDDSHMWLATDNGMILKLGD